MLAFVVNGASLTINTSKFWRQQKLEVIVQVFADVSFGPDKVRAIF